MKETLLAWWAQRAKREQYMLLGGGFILVLLLTIDWGILPAIERIDRLDRLISQKEQDVSTFNQLNGSYQLTHRQLNKIKAQLDRQEATFSLVAYLEQLTITQRMNHTVVGLRPQSSAPYEGYQETAVELSLEKVALSQIIRFLETLESSQQYIHVKRFSMKSRFSDSSLLDIRLTVSSYAPTTQTKTSSG